MKPPYIDVWDATTFDEELRDILGGKSDLIRNYVNTENQILLSHDLNDTRGTILRPDNPFASAFYAFTESLIGVMERRAIRGWHYTRLLDSEVERMCSAGIHLSTVESLTTKLDALVSAGDVSRTEADALFAGSRDCPKFCVTDHELPTERASMLGGTFHADTQRDLGRAAQGLQVS